MKNILDTILNPVLNSVLNPGKILSDSPCILFGILIIISVLCLPQPLLAEDTYTPLYSYRDWKICYKENGQVGEPWIYEKRSGFTGFFDPFDPKIVCQVENPDNCTTPPDDDTVTLALHSEQSDDPTVKADFFKIYLPPGCVKLTFVLFPNSKWVKVNGEWQQADVDMGFAVRFREPVQGGYDSLGDYDDYNWESSSPGTPAEFENRDVLLKNMGGKIEVLCCNFPEVQTGGWMYIRVLHFDDPSYVHSFTYSMKVNVDSYVDWYTSVPTPFNSLGNPYSGGDPGPGFLEANDLNGNGKIDMQDVILKLQEPVTTDRDQAVEQMLEVLSGG